MRAEKAGSFVRWAGTREDVASLARFVQKRIEADTQESSTTTISVAQGSLAVDYDRVEEFLDNVSDTDLPYISYLAIQVSTESLSASVSLSEPNRIVVKAESRTLAEGFYPQLRERVREGVKPLRLNTTGQEFLAGALAVLGVIAVFAVVVANEDVSNWMLDRGVVGATAISMGPFLVAAVLWVVFVNHFAQPLELYPAGGQTRWERFETFRRSALGRMMWIVIAAVLSGVVALALGWSP